MICHDSDVGMVMGVDYAYDEPENRIDQLMWFFADWGVQIGTLALVLWVLYS